MNIRLLMMLAALLSGGHAWGKDSAREAVDLFKTDAARASRALSQAVEKHPEIGTALKVLEAEALLSAGQRKRALEAAAAVALLDERWANRASWVAARAAAGHDCNRAMGFLERVRIDPPWIHGAAVLALKASVAERCDAEEKVSEFEQALAIKFPLTTEGRAATGRVKLTADDRLKRSRAMEMTGDYLAAEAELTTLLGTDFEDEARFRMARLHLERVRDDYDLSWRIFSELSMGDGPRAEESAWLEGKALGRKGEVVGAITAFERYQARFPSGRYAEDAEFFIAFLLYENGRYREAAKAFGAIKAGSWSAAAAWYAPWCLYLAGDVQAAQPMFAKLGMTGAKKRLRRKAQYWSARAAESFAPKLARTLRKKLVNDKPHDWYGLLARRRFPKEFSKVRGLPRRVRLRMLQPPRGFRKTATEVRSLMKAGLPDFARRALANASGRLRAADLWAVEASLAAEVGDASRLYLSTISRHKGLTEKPPKARDTARWRGTYPLAYESVVEEMAESEQVSPMLIYSFMRTESAFNPDVISPAHAVGLMQLLPRTANRILKSQGQGGQKRSAVKVRSSDVDLTEKPDLFDPTTNIRLGTWYVGALSERFKGQLPLVSAAYNAGPRSVVGWCRDIKRMDTDIFVERIPFRETRRYVKKMIETRVAYGLVHEGKTVGQAAGVLPVSLNLSVEPGVSF